MTDEPEQLVFEDIQRHLEGLTRTSDGELLYRMIERSLDKQGIGANEPVTESFIRFMHSLLGRYASDTRANPVTRVKARLIQQHLSVHMSEPAPASRPPQRKEDGPRPADNPVPATQKIAPAPAVEQTRKKPKIDRPTATETPEIVAREAKVDLAGKIASTVEQNREFNKLLKSNLRVLKLADNAEDLMDLKSLLVKGMEELLEGTDKMGGDLGETSDWLARVVEDHEKMQSKLANASRQSPLDVITGLPKRDSLQRFITAEVSRAQRYGFSIGLVLLAISELEQINSTYGKDARDDVLRIYGRDVFSRLRSYDIAVRYGPDQFAVLLPNTHKNGAERTLEKLQKLVSDLVFQAGQKTLRLPGFSSVLTMHAAGENAETLLSRADEALAMLKMRGGQQNLYLAPTS